MKCRHGFISTSWAWEERILIPHRITYAREQHNTLLPIRFMLLVMCGCSWMDSYMMTSSRLRMRITDWATHLRPFIYSRVTCDMAAYHKDICPSVCYANLATSRAFHHHRCRLRVLMHMSMIKGGCSLITTWWQVWHLFLVHLHVFLSKCLALGRCHTHTFTEVSLEIDLVLYHIITFVVQMPSRQVPCLKMSVHIR